MRKLIVKRKKSFVGGMLPYLLVAGVEVSEFSKMNDEEKENTICWEIANGESLEIDIPKDADRIFALSVTSGGCCYSNEMKIQEGNDGEKIEIITKYNLFKGTTLTLSWGK